MVQEEVVEALAVAVRVRGRVVYFHHRLFDTVFDFDLVHFGLDFESGIDRQFQLGFDLGAAMIRILHLVL